MWHRAHVRSTQVNAECTNRFVFQAGSYGSIKDVDVNHPLLLFPFDEHANSVFDFDVDKFRDTPNVDNARLLRFARENM